MTLTWDGSVLLKTFFFCSKSHFLMTVKNYFRNLDLPVFSSLRASMVASSGVVRYGIGKQAMGPWYYDETKLGMFYIALK